MKNIDDNNKVILVKELDGFTGTACLVIQNGHFYVVSSTDAFGTPETLVFPSDTQGIAIDWTEVAGGKHMSREEAIDQLEKRHNGV